MNLKKLEETLRRLLDESRIANSDRTFSEDYEKTIKSLQDEIWQKQREFDEAKKAGYGRRPYSIKTRIKT
ncbi:MAG: hypothetical protein PUJ69_00010 [Porphyromonas somerae]|uniref:hypothetical protein n=1 Tax=Porphyromonas somerae TaxID=322095 RepID=UPI0026EA80C4|nr:hypothetical protein [Porphyromonas somerae]MDD7557050.1 hypothetical protein [Porphyromonas somerae]MDY3884372.1 hypothetical protein [Porphyromonas somerae]MDY5815085.1 hypothetical protein [Porphyromonas somerae]